MSSSVGRTNAKIEVTPSGCRVESGPRVESYPDHNDARLANEWCREAHDRLRALINSVARGTLDISLNSVFITPFCRALSGQLPFRHGVTQVSIFTDVGDDKERTRAVQLSFRAPDGKYIDYYDTRAARLLDPYLDCLLTSAKTYLDAGEIA